MTYRVIFVVVLALAIASLVGGVAGLLYPTMSVSRLAGRFMNSASALMGLASLAQLQVSGWFERILAIYGDETKFPYGPPSEITRQIIDNPDHPVQTWLRNTLFFEPGTGAFLAVTSLIIAVVAAWL